MRFESAHDAHPRPITKLPPLGMMPLQLTVVSSTRSVLPGSSVRYLKEDVPPGEQENDTA